MQSSSEQVDTEWTPGTNSLKSKNHIFGEFLTVFFSSFGKNRHKSDTYFLKHENLKKKVLSRQYSKYFFGSVGFPEPRTFFFLA